MRTYLLSNVIVWVSALATERAEKTTVRAERTRVKLGAMML